MTKRDYAITVVLVIASMLVGAALLRIPAVVRFVAGSYRYTGSLGVETTPERVEIAPGDSLRVTAAESVHPERIIWISPRAGLCVFDSPVAPDADP